MGETRVAIIKHKPLPEYTPSARLNRIAGKVILKMVLSASAKVQNINVVEGLPFGLTDKSIEAARRIEFEPAVHRDGRLLSQWIHVEYVFTSGGDVSARHYP
jgi:TonB family protein